MVLKPESDVNHYPPAELLAFSNYRDHNLFLLYFHSDLLTFCSDLN